MGVKVTLKALRINNGLTQDDASKLVGVSKDTWASWENGKSYPKTPQVDVITKRFGVTYDDIEFYPKVLLNKTF